MVWHQNLLGSVIPSNSQGCSELNFQVAQRNGVMVGQ